MVYNVRVNGNGPISSDNNRHNRTAILAPSFTDVTSIPQRLPAVAPAAVAISYHAPSHSGVRG